MQTLIADQNFKPSYVTGYELTAASSDSGEFSPLMSVKPCHSSRNPAERLDYKPGKYATLPTQTFRANLRSLSVEAGKSKPDRCSAERSDKRASHSLETQRKSPLLPTGYDGRPVLSEEFQWESVWNPRASMAFDNAKGLLNPLGQNNCFLNSAVQVLWHLDVFRRNFRLLSGHGCVQNSCIFCALKVIFTQFQFSDHKVLPSDVLREALAEAFANEHRFQLGRMDDASECFETILQRIHFHLAWNQSEETCQVLHCIPHQKFAMLLVEQMACDCNVSDEPLIFNQLVYHVSTSAIISYLRLARLGASSEWNVSFGRLLYRARSSGETRRCTSSCGGLIETRHTLANTPEVISIGFIWDSDHPSRSRVRKVIQCISTELRPSELVYSVVDEDWGQTTTLRLVGLVCYHGRHYSTFVFHSKMLTWILFDDARVREIGPDWETLMDLCVAGLYQPLLLLYANPNGRPIDVSAAPARNISLEREPCSVLEEIEHDAIPEATLNEKQANASRCQSSRRDLLFGGDCTKSGRAVCTHLSPDCQHKAQSMKIQEAPAGQMQSPETMSLTRDESTLRFMDSTKRNNGDFLMLNHLSSHKTGDNFPQANVIGQRMIATKKAAGNSSANTDDRENSCCLNLDQVVGAGPRTAVANGTHGSIVSKTLEPPTNRGKTVQFSHQGVGMSPGGTVESFVISDVKQYPRFHEQFTKKSNLLCSADHVSNSLQFVENKSKDTDSDEVRHRSSGDGVSDGSLTARNNIRTVETICESNRGLSHSTDEGKGCGVYINEKAVRSVLSSQGVTCRRLTPRENSRSVQTGGKTAEGDLSRNRKSTETKAKSSQNTNCNSLPVSRAQTRRNLSGDKWETGNGCLGEAEFSDNKCTDGQQLVLCNRTSSTKPAVSKLDATSKYPARTSKLLSNTECSSADLTTVSKTATTHGSASAHPAVIPSKSTEISVSSVPRVAAAASCQPAVTSIPSSSVDTSQGYNTFPRRRRNIESQASNSTSFPRSLNSSHSSWSKTRNQLSEYNACELTANEQISTVDDNGNNCRWVEQRSDGTPECQSALSPPLNIQVTDWQPPNGINSDDLDCKDDFSVSNESKMQLFRDSLQLLTSCDEYVKLSKAELDMGNEILAAEHCSMASALLEDAFQNCQLDNDLRFLFRCSRNNVQKCQSNLKRYLAHFSNNDEANKEQVGSVRNMEPVFYLSAYVPSRQVEPVDMNDRSVDECKISSLDICSRVSAAEDEEVISKCQLRPTVNLTRDPDINRKIVNASKVKSKPQSNFSRVNNANTVEPSCVSTNGKFTNSVHDCRSSSSLPKNRTNISSSSKSLPRNSTSASSSMSLPRNNTSVSSSMSLPRNNTSVSSSMSLPRNSTNVSSSMSLPRNRTNISSSSYSTLLPRNRTSVTSMSLSGTSLLSLSTKGTSASLCTRNTSLPASMHKQLPKSRTSYQAGNTGNSETTCRTRADTLTDRELERRSNSNDHVPFSGNRNILDPTHGERCTNVLSSASVPSLLELTLESGDGAKPDGRGAGLNSWLDSAAGESSSLLLMSQKLQKLEKQNREIRDKLLKDKDVLWS